MAHLIDSNLLLRWTQPQAPEHALAVAATAKVRRQGSSVTIVPQCLIEFWGVATRPVQANGFGLPVAVVQQELQRIKQFFPLLSDVAAIYPAWEQIVAAFQVQGKQVHDARLVAAMQVHGIAHILTFNAADFLRYQSLGITVVHPANA